MGGMRSADLAGQLPRLRRALPTETYALKP